MKVLSLCVSVLLLAWAGVAVGQQQADSSGQGQGGPGILVKADSLKGSEVVDTNGRKLGKVDDVSINLMTGQISYVAVDTGKGDKLVPVPYGAFGVMKDKKLVLNVDPNRLDAAPSYSKRSEPNWVNQQWAQQVSNYWGKSPSGIVTGQASPGQRAPGEQPSAMGSSGQPGAAQQPMSSGAPPAGSAGRQPT